MRHRILGAIACALALVSLYPAHAAERSVGDTRPARTYVEVVTIDPVTGLPSSGGGGGGTSGGVATAATPTRTEGQVYPLSFDLNGALRVTGGGGGGGSGTEFAEDAVHASGALGTLGLGVRKDAAASLAGTDGDYTASIYDSTGRLWVNPGTVPVTGTFWQATQPVSGTFWQATQPISAAALPLPSGAATSAKQPALGTAGTASPDVISVQGVAGGVAQPISAASLPLPTGAATLAGVAAPQGTFGAVVANRTVLYDSVGNPIDFTAASPVNLAAAATGGCTPYGYQSAASNNASSVKASAGTLCSLNIINTTATLYYLRLYNLAAAPTCSSATGFVKTIPIPASTTGAGVALDLGAYGEAYTTGLAFCLTAGGASTDNTNAATGVYVSASFK